MIDGAPIANQRIVIAGGPYEATSAANGYYKITGLPNGTYQVRPYVLILGAPNLLSWTHVYQTVTTCDSKGLGWEK